MTKQLTVTTMVCSAYQRLLEESARAKDAWREFHEDISWAQLVPKETVDELLRLQAKYARAYALLVKHAHTCERCEPLSRTA